MRKNRYFHRNGVVKFKIIAFTIQGRMCNTSRLMFISRIIILITLKLIDYTGTSFGRQIKTIKFVSKYTQYYIY